MNSDEACRAAKRIDEDLRRIIPIEAAPEKEAGRCAEAYDLVVTDSELRLKTEGLFRGGHYARAVEEAYKLLDNVVRKKTQIKQSGFALMTAAFNAKNPKLRLNPGQSISDNDEQEGYMHIFAGSMRGIRNPRVHECEWEDDEVDAIELLSLANHLISKVRNSVK